ncbi:MAG: DUF1232 domain-containing protein [bacterium]
MGLLGARHGLAATALAIAVGCLNTLSPTPSLAIDLGPSVERLQLPMQLLLDDEAFDQQIGGATKGMLREVRRYWRTLNWMFGRATAWWGGWFKRGVFSLIVAIIAALADTGLLNAWRLNGWRTVTTYVPMMLYVYGRLLFSRGVNLGPKLMLVAALIYGVVRNDLIPDRRFFHGRIEDIVLIVLATRAFIYACPETLVDEFAGRAINLRRRIASFQHRAG